MVRKTKIAAERLKNFLKFIHIRGLGWGEVNKNGEEWIMLFYWQNISPIATCWIHALAAAGSTICKVLKIKSKEETGLEKIKILKFDFLETLRDPRLNLLFDSSIVDFLHSTKDCKINVLTFHSFHLQVIRKLQNWRTL